MGRSRFLAPLEGEISGHHVLKRAVAAPPCNRRFRPSRSALDPGRAFKKASARRPPLSGRFFFELKELGYSTSALGRA